MSGSTDLSRLLQSVGPVMAWPSAEEVAAARADHDAWRAAIGRKSAPLLTTGNMKAEKGEATIRTLELYPGTIRPEIIPADLAAAIDGATFSRLQVCRWSTASCDPGRGGGCLGTTAGHNAMPYAHRGKMSRTLFAHRYPRSFVVLVIEETRRAVGNGHRVRLNTTSDLEWHRIAPVLFAEGSPTRGAIYDYTKDHRRDADGWHLTYSASERHGPEEIAAKVGRGHNVSVVLNLRRGDPMPDQWRGVPVIDGDKHDERWTDPRGVIVGLRAKDSTGRGLSTQVVGVRSFVKPAS